MKVSKKGVESYSSDTISKTQREVLDMLTKQYLTIKKIAKLRGTTIQAVYKIYKKLRKKGLISKGFNRGLKNYKVLTPQKGEIVRLHGQQFAIKIISHSNLYKIYREKNNITFFEDNVVQLFKNTIVISANELLFFYGKTANMAMAKSLKHWMEFMLRIEDRLNIRIFGKTSQIKQTNCHFAVWDEELGRYVESLEERRIKVNATEDGKLWFITDKSFGDAERECIHPETPFGLRGGRGRGRGSRGRRGLYARRAASQHLLVCEDRERLRRHSHRDVNLPDLLGLRGGRGRRRGCGRAG